MTNDVIRTEPQADVPRMYRVLVEVCTETRYQCLDQSTVEHDEHPHLYVTFLMTQRKRLELFLKCTPIIQIEHAYKVEKFLKHHDPMFESFEKGFENSFFLVQLFVEMIEEIYQIRRALDDSVFFVIRNQKLTRFSDIQNV